LALGTAGCGHPPVKREISRIQIPIESPNNGLVAQLVAATGLKPVGWGFDFLQAHQTKIIEPKKEILILYFGKYILEKVRL
jgi:hypothetical protein